MLKVNIAAAWVYLSMHPEGVIKGDLCRAIGIPSQCLESLLQHMEARDYLLSEDKYGRLFVFDPDWWN